MHKMQKNNTSDKLVPVLDIEFCIMLIINTAQTQLLTNIFCLPGHTLLVQPIEQIPASLTNSSPSIKDKLYEREKYWIDKLKTVYPQGLNWTAGRSTH